MDTTASKMLVDISTGVLSVLIPWGVGVGIQWISAKIEKEHLVKSGIELAQKQGLVQVAVGYAQKSLSESPGKDKYDAAAKWAAAQAVKAGLKISESEMEGLIESAVLTLKASLKTEISNTASSASAGKAVQ